MLNESNTPVDMYNTKHMPESMNITKERIKETMSIKENKHNGRIST